MPNQHMISDYIDNISFKKKLCFGFTPDEVYETIRKLTAMYNEMLGKSYQEIAELKSEIKKSGELPRVTVQNRAWETQIADDDVPETHDTLSYSGATFTYQTIPNYAGVSSKERSSTADKYQEAQLSNMNRRELLDVLLESRQENEQLIDEIRYLTERNRQLIDQLEDKKLKINKAGSIAEASVLLNGVIESTQSAAQQYLDNLRELCETEQMLHEEKETEARRQAQQILDEATQQCETLVRDTRGKCLLMESDAKIACDEMREKAKAEVDAYWTDLTAQLESFYNAHEGLKDLLQHTGQLPQR